MQHGDDAHNANNGDIKLTRMAVRAREWEGLFLGLLTVTNSVWVRFRLDSSPDSTATALRLFHRVASAGKAPDTNGMKECTHARLEASNCPKKTAWHARVN